MLLYLFHTLYKHPLSKERKEFGSSFALCICGLFLFVMIRQTKARVPITVQAKIATGNFCYTADLCQDSLKYINLKFFVVLFQKVDSSSKCPVSKWPYYVIKFESQFPIFYGAIGYSRVLRFMSYWKESFQCLQQALDLTLACLPHCFWESFTLLDFTLSSFWNAY